MHEKWITLIRNYIFYLQGYTGITLQVLIRLRCPIVNSRREQSMIGGVTHILCRRRGDTRVLPLAPAPTGSDDPDSLIMSEECVVISNSKILLSKQTVVRCFDALKKDPSTVSLARI